MRIGEKDQEIKSLQLTIADYQKQNDNLQNLLTMSEDDLMMATIELGLKQEELDESDNEINDLLDKLVASEAETYFAKGEGMELMASRIEFAPKRKKEALEGALENYDRAYDLGYQAAGDKVAVIKAKLKID